MGMEFRWSREETRVGTSYWETGIGGLFRGSNNAFVEVVVWKSNVK